MNMRVIKLTGYLAVHLLALTIVHGCAVTSTQSDADEKAVAGANLRNVGEPSREVEVSAHVQDKVRSGLAKVAEDFVHALQQIPSHLPTSTTIQIPQSDSADSVTQAFRAAFEAGGYGVRLVDAIANDNAFQYRLEDESYDDASGRHRFEIAVGDVEMRRTYGGLLLNNVHPVTPLYVKGADATKVILNDAAFASAQQNQAAIAPNRLNDITEPSSTNAGVLRENASVSSVGSTEQHSETFVAATIDEPIEVVRETQARTPLSVPDEINPLQNMVSAQYGAGSFSLPLVALSEVQNVFELGTSNYIDVLSDLDVVAQQTLTFPNDSLRLGNLNKQLVENMVTRYEPTTDIFSVIGCSMGPTALEHGNAALALGRASRVREALLFAGVDREKILDEGCWAGDSEGNTLPRRGVVLTLNRKI